MEGPAVHAPPRSRLPIQDLSTRSTSLEPSRPVSAPPSSTPSATDHCELNSAKRIPLADKTDIKLAVFRGAVSSTLEPDALLPAVEDETEQHEMVTPSINRIPMRATTKLGESEKDKTLQVMHSLSQIPTQLPSKLGRDVVGDRVQGRIPVSAWTPASTRGYVVPHTVARKKWEF